MGVPDKQYPMTVYRLILMTAAAVWGLGFVIGKGAIGTVGATWFTAIRFLGAGIVLVILLFPHLKRNFCRKTLKAGLIIGMATFVGFWTQFLGLGLTTPSKNAFLSACYCLTVPFIWWVVSRRRPPAKTLIAAAICTVGIGLVSLTEGFSISLGDGVSIASAFLYGGEIVIIGLVMRDNDVLTITVVQQSTAGILALLLALAYAHYGAGRHARVHRRHDLRGYALGGLRRRGAEHGAGAPVPLRGRPALLARKRVLRAVQRGVLRRGAHGPHGDGLRVHLRRHRGNSAWRQGQRRGRRRLLCRRVYRWRKHRIGKAR